ncbi:stress protein [Streptomyces cinereoruber]|uniref:Asp23/Gls24 family envelope stress response protein n=1 Tax=Streptomyces cinereoruber TaxID=67260 RepID=A0AAV4KI68_9ACTN|nr:MULTISPECIES: Asp23/Gls24 family envelope stress response protein [Streptomyces]AVH98106.1 Asp23/Gls24 family envelope stress response protein [Streptomyces sp. WAC00288]KYG56693.1 stress protein [Streptomyces sp. WAC04657]MBB4161959.1 putative alkaline shock family protein YloU [Streptomyces cinereoruber]MBY8817248.1 Asp23/Gls24 family envelope stress response protein [Streptomyces cinereoruber]NIH64439.1 putative alkaline shock family protein YloU [Streptomyces cinereoruber]
MTDTTHTGDSGSDESRRTSVTKRGGGPAATRGKTTIADGVVEKIAGLAARDVDGVHAMGSGLSRTFGAVRDRVPGGGGSKANATRGVKAEVGEVQTALDLEIVVEYGYAISDVAGDVRENVVNAVERMTGLEVVEVNIAVSDVKLPDDDDDDDGDDDQRRLQ